MRKKKKKVEQKTFLSDRQKKILVIVTVVLLLAVPLGQTIRCKMACMKRVKTPYPEIACKYECPWFWEKSE